MYLCVNRAPLVLSFRQVSRGWSGLFVGFTALWTVFFVAVLLLPIALYLTHKQQPHSSVCAFCQPNRTNERTKKNYAFFSYVYFNEFYMFVARIHFDVDFSFLFHLNGMLVRNCHERCASQLAIESIKQK